jgi:hypothetical protein
MSGSSDVVESAVPVSWKLWGRAKASGGSFSALALARLQIVKRQFWPKLSPCLVHTVSGFPIRRCIWPGGDFKFHLLGIAAFVTNRTD